jgi:hypothetical protein
VSRLLHHLVPWLPVAWCAKYGYNSTRVDSGNITMFKGNLKATYNWSASPCVRYCMCLFGAKWELLKQDDDLVWVCFLLLRRVCILVVCFHNLSKQILGQWLSQSSFYSLLVSFSPGFRPCCVVGKSWLRPGLALDWRTIICIMIYTNILYYTIYL